MIIPGIAREGTVDAGAGILMLHSDWQIKRSL